MGLVVYKGAQYDADRLPAHVNPKDCVPLDEWLRRNRVTATRPQMADYGNDGAVAEAIQRAETAEQQLADAQARIAELEAAGGSVKTVDEMSKAELVAYAEQHDIEIDASANKPEILDAIKAATK